MNDEQETFMDSYAFTQATLFADGTMLEALIMSHPNPAALQDCWDRLVAPRLATAMQDVVGRTAERPVDRLRVQRLQDWTERLERHFPRP